jgi:hypothetical protein
MFKHKLPGDPTVLGMGFFSVAVIFFFADLTFFLFVAFFVGIAGISKGADNLKLYDESPDMFYERSKKNVADGRHISGFAMLTSLIMLIITGIRYLIN